MTKNPTDFTDYKRNNRICLRNFNESCDFHDLIKFLLVRMLRRKNPDSRKVPIYTEHNPEKESEEFPDIWMRIKGEVYVFEIQKEITQKWSIEIAKRYEDVTLIIVPSQKIYETWTKEIIGIEGFCDPIAILKDILQDYVI